MHVISAATKEMDNSIDPSTLKPEQRKRFEWALAEYARIQERNLPGGLNPSQPGVTPLLKHYPNPKSALFQRLLDGKSPLAHPPPTNYSYPWYQLIEDGFSDNVSIDGFDYVGGRPGVIINQAPWVISSNNQAADRLMELAPKMNPARRPTLSREESGLVAGILDGNPEWIVRNGRNPEFRLFMTRVTRRGRRDLMLNSLLQRDFSGGHPKVVQPVGPPPFTMRASFESTAKPRSKEDLLMRITDLQLTADTIGLKQPEWALVECDGWVLDEVR
jgi:hypothetical protein